jgi:hypothetical protein
MTTLAQDKRRDYGAVSKVPGSADVIADDIIYEGAAVGESATAGTARPLVAADVFLGFAFRKADNAGGLVSAIKVELVVMGVITLPITSVALANVGEPVYASDDDVFTLASTGNSPVGKVVEVPATGTARVYFEAAAYRSI